MEAELATVGPDFAVVHATTEPGVRLQTSIGSRRQVTTGPHHVVGFDGLAPGREYELQVEGVTDPYLPPAFRTLTVPEGGFLTRFVTVNDVHFGETVCGQWDSDPMVGPVFRSGPDKPPYPEMMNAAAVAAIAANPPDLVVAKGDLTTSSAAVDLARFRAVWGDAFGDRLLFVRGNHDATMEGGVRSRMVGNVTLAVLDTTVVRQAYGAFPTDQLAWLAQVAMDASGPVFAFGHHPPFSDDFDEGREVPFCSSRADADALMATLDEHERIAGYFCGHTHRNRVRQSPGGVPIVEVASVKEYPGAWAEYRVYEHGYMQIVHRLTTPAALDWMAKTRQMFHGLYREYSLGSLDDRCFTRSF